MPCCMETILTTQREDTPSCTACVSVLCVLQRTCYHIVGNFRGRKLSQIGEKYNFHGENFRRLLAFAVPKDATPQILQRKLSHIATNPQNSQKFSPSKVSRYTVSLCFMTRNLEIRVCNSHCHCWYIFHYTTALTICPFLIALATSSALILIPGRGRVGASVCMVLGTMALRAFSGAGV